MVMIDTKATRTYIPAVKPSKLNNLHAVDEAAKAQLHNLAEMGDVDYSEIQSSIRKLSHIIIGGLYASFLNGSVDPSKCATSLASIGKMITSAQAAEANISKLLELTPQAIASMNPETIKIRMEELFEAVKKDIG
jgi:hypothetical protein